MDEKSSTSGCKKRKRASKDTPDDSDNDAEYELYTKYFNTDPRRKKYYCKTYPKNQEGPKKLVCPQKRKYCYPTEELGSRKVGKFSYLTDFMTKQRKRKTTETESIQNFAKVEAKVLSPEKSIIDCKQVTNKIANDEETLLRDSKYNNCDLFHSEETGCNYEASKKQDLSFYILDEIALEGLDGITIEAFWKRIRAVFPAHINKTMCERIWRTVCNNKHIDLHILEKPREELISNIRSNYVDVEKGEYVEPFIEFRDIYPLVPINDDDVRGSCSTFASRKRNNMAKKYSLEKAVSTYGRKLVIVADQVLRNKALFSDESDPNVDCIDIEYCMLERIGRSRFQGEISQGNMSLKCMEGDSHKNTHHNRKNLEKNALVASQPFFIKSITAQQNKTCTLLNLPRFYHKRKTKQIMIMEKISRILKERPNYEIEMTEFWSVLGREMGTLKIFKSPEFRKFFNVSLVPYRRVHPDALKSEYMMKAKKKERLLRVVRLLDPTVNVLAIYDNKDCVVPPKTSQFDQPAHFFHNSDILRNAYKYIVTCGKEGAVTHEVLEAIQLDFYAIRLALRKLLARDLLSTKKIDSFRQQSGKFYPKHHDDPELQLNTTIPKKYELSGGALSKLRAQYESNLQPDSIMYSGSEVEPVLISENKQISNSISRCAIFQTDISPGESDGINICDIIAMGRDRLLLAHSNLLMFFESEDLHKYVLKRLNFVKTTPFFMYGFGKVVCDFLNTVNLTKAFATDNLIVFSASHLTADSKVTCSPVHICIQMAYFTDGYDGQYEYDIVSKVYLFEALFDENHVGQKAGQMLKNIFERFQVHNGLKKVDQGKENSKKINLEITSQVVMEKFMGPKPELVFSQDEEDGVKMEIFISTPPSGFIEPGTEFKSLVAEKTQRFEDRTNLVLKWVYDNKVVRDTVDFVNVIRTKEKEEGFDRLICRKSVKRILCRLVMDGYVKVIKVVLTGKSLIKARSLICVPNVNVDHGLVQSTVEELRLKFYTAHRASVGHAKTTVNVKTKSQSPFSSADVKNSITELKQLVSSDCRVPVAFDCSIARIRYGYSPKFVRMRILHEFIFYVMRDMRTAAPLPLEEVAELCDSFRIKMRKTDVTSLPTVYRKEISWKMFIPPLPQHREWPVGWALACDITLRLPLSVFLKLYNTRFEIPEIEPYIRHPIKRHFLLKHLPPNIRNLLLFKRKYLFSIHEIFSNLCYIGLLQLGPRHYKEKDQIFIYLNENASLFDTCSSSEGYNKIEKKQYKKLTFKFRIAKDVEQYWMEMWRICINTPLGRRKIMEGKYVTIEKSDSKPSLIETLKPATPQTAPGRDTGRIPGDHLGAAGLDSSLWSYVKRNWLWSVHLDKRNVDLQSHVSGLRKEHMKNVLPKPIEFEHLSKLNATDNKLYLKRPLQPATLKVSKHPKTRRIICQAQSKKKVLRKVLPYPTKEKRQYNDALDEGIMRKNKSSRIGWDGDEDALLRLLKAGATFLCPQIKNQTIPFNVIRDIMHRVCPKSRNKTSSCIRRRFHQLVIHDNIMRIMEVNVENLLNSEVISKYFEQLHDRYRSGEKVSHNNLNVAYIYLMSYMIEHRSEIELLLLGYIATVDFFSEPYIELFSLLLDNLEMENAQGTYGTPTTVDEIIRDSIKSIIHCSLSCKKDSPGWAYHLFHIYRNFSDETIRSVVIELRKKHFLTISKMTEGKQSNWHIPIKFSYLYSTMKSSTYTIEMFLEAYQSFKSAIDESRGLPEGQSSCEFLSYNEIRTFWEKLNFVFDIPEMGIILNPAFEDHTEVIDELSKRLHLYLQRIHESQKVEKENVVESVDKIGEDFERIKNYVTRIIFRVPYLMEGALDMYYKKLMDSTSSLEINNYIFLMTIDLKNFAQSNILSKPEFKKFVDDIEDYAEEWRAAVKNLSKVVFVIQQYNKNKDAAPSDEVSLEAAFEIWEREELNFDSETLTAPGISTRLVGAQFAIKNISNGMDYCLKKAVEGEFPSVDEIKEGLMADFDETEKRKIPHITDVTMLLTKERFPDLDADEETVRLWKEHFVYQYPKLDKVLIQDADEFMKVPEVKRLFDEDAHNAIFNEIHKPVVAKKPNMLEVLSYITSEGGGKDEVQFVENVIGFVQRKMQFGATCKELKDNFLGQDPLDLHRVLQSLCSMNVFLRTGVSEIVFVHYKFQSEWMVETFSLTDKEKELFQSKNKNDAKKLRTDIAERLKVTAPLRVVLKPWTTLDGNLNKQVLLEWLCVVLSHCLDNPNISFVSLCRNFSHLKPVDVFYLVEVLQSIGSIEINLCASTSSSLICSRRKENLTKATFLDSFDEMIITSLEEASLCIGACLEKECIDQQLSDFVLDEMDS